MVTFFEETKTEKNTNINSQKVPEEKIISVDRLVKYNAPRLKGHFLFGNFLELAEKDGRGFHRFVLRCAEKASVTEKGRCLGYFGPYEVLLITDPEDLKYLIGRKSQNGSGHFSDLIDKDVTGIFELVFGPDAIFVNSIDTAAFQEARAEFVNYLKTPAILQGYLPTMWNVIQRHMQEIEANAGTVKLYQTLNFIALDIISETQLGFKSFDNEIKKMISEKISAAMLELTKPITMLKSNIPFATQYPFKNYIFSQLVALVDEVRALIKKLIEVNAENILATDNFISRMIKKNKLPKDKITVTKEMIDVVSQVLVAGHETTTKLMFFSMMLLADEKYRVHLERIREEMKTFNDLPSREDFADMHYLQAFMLEVLRLYPPIVHMIFQVKNPIPFDGDTLQPGTFIVTSPFVTHQLDHVYLNAGKFDPTRFLDEEGKLLSGIVDPENFSFLTFGFDIKKQCPGNMFARLEASALLFYFVKQYNFTASHTVDPKTSYTQLAAMKLNEELEFEATMTFKKIQPEEEKRESMLCQNYFR